MSKKKLFEDLLADIPLPTEPEKPKKNKPSEDEKQENHREEQKPVEKEKEHQPEEEPFTEPVELPKDDLPDDLDYLVELAKRKKTKIKETFDIERDLHRQMNALAKKYGYGFKTRFINSAIRRELERIKQLEKEK